jgi:hypothetical protein
MNSKVLFAGIDGSGKSSCMEAVIERLESEYNILKISNYDPCIFYKGKKTPAFKFKTYSILNYIRPISVKYKFFRIFLLINFTYKYVLSKYLEISKKSNFIIYETDLLLHPVVYITYHFPYSKLLNKTLGFKLVSLFFGSKKKSIIFYLDTKSEIAMDRIRKRGNEIDPHENLEDLENLRLEFNKVLQVALDCGYEIYRIDTNKKNLNAVVDEVQLILEKSNHGRRACEI